MTCLDDATVLGLVEGRLAPAQLADVDEHIDSCEACRAVVTLVASARMPARTLAAGSKLGRFEIRELLGTGAMGRVYSAFERDLDRHIALKVLIDDGPGAREQLMKEAQAMARLSHPHVMTVHEVGVSDAGVYVAMELVTGDTLRTWVSARRPWREVVPLLVDIARGLAAVHDAGVVHRDIKPDNVIVDRGGRVRLGDFGLARAGESGGPPATPPLALGSDTTIAGTPAYMAPEVLRGAAATPASDQFSFGVMAHELLAGRRPFDGIARGEAPRLTGVPAAVASTLARCLESDPARRWRSMREVADALASAGSRRRARVAAAAALALAVLASGATWLVTRGDGPRVATCDVALPASRGDVAFDQWAGAWTAERIDACRTQEPARQRCLDQRRADAVALANRVGGPALLDALASLPPPSECKLATATAAPPHALLAGELSALRAIIASGESALAASELVVERARALDGASLAEALLVHADALRSADRLADAALAARDAAAAATRGHADLLAARAWLARVAIAGERRELASAEDVGALAEAAVARIGSPPHLVALLDRLRGMLAYNRGELASARTFLLAARERAAPGTLELAAIESALGSVARAAGDLDEAQRRHAAALALHRTLRGERHPEVARDLHNVAGVLRLRGDLEAAAATYREALAIEIATQGERSIAAGLTHNSLGLVLMAQQEWTAARTELALARDILTAARHGDLAFAEHNLGLVAQATGDHRTALAQFDRASELYAATIGGTADPARRLVADRDRSRAALTPRPRPALPPPPTTKSEPPRDVGVYGAAQPW